MKIRVYYEDTDMGGVVYHSNYLNFCERARSEYFFQQGATPHLEEGEFVAASLQASFKASAKLGDLLDVRTEVLSIKSTSLLLSQSVYRGKELLFEMQIKLGFVKNAKIGRLSDEAQAFLLGLFELELK